MPKLRRLSGQEAIAAFRSFGFEIAAQRGSHVKLRRLVRGNRQTLTIPNHDELDAGTLRAIIRHASAYIPEHELAPFFYSA